MGKILHVLALAILTWNCVAHSYTIRNMYKRMPVDRSLGPQGPQLQKRTKITPSNSGKSRQTPVEPAGIPIPTLSSSAKEAVTNVRNELSSLGGSIIGGFTDLTGLKLKDKPGFDLPFIPSTLQPGVKKIKKTGGLGKLINQLSTPTQNTQAVAATQAQTQFKRQTGQPNFDAPPYVAAKDAPAVWYTEPAKPPLHVKIGQDLKGLVDSIFPPKPSNYQLIPEDNDINTGLVRDERDSTYGAPASPAYGAPEVTYEPAEPTYGAPEPDTSYGAPESSYDAPSYNAVDHGDVLNTMIYGSEEKLPLLIKIITDYNKVFNFYAAQSAQMAAFYAPGIIPILRSAGFDVKRVRWVPELLEKLKPAEEASYGAPVASYGEPEVSYGEPEVTYEAAETSYGAPATTYEQPEPSYGAPAPSYQPKVTYQPVATEPVPVYHAPDNSYAAPSHYAPPEHNYVHASSKRDKKDVTKSSIESLDVTPTHHDNLLTAVPALELLKLKTKLNRKEARERIDQAEERSSRNVEIAEAEERTSRLKETLEKIEEIEEENEMDAA